MFWYVGGTGAQRLEEYEEMVVRSVAEGRAFNKMSVYRKTEGAFIEVVEVMEPARWWKRVED